MKIQISVLVMSLTGLVSGCALNHPNVSLEPVGPGPVVASFEADKGDLLVYTAWDTGMSSDQSDLPVQHHSGYKIYSAEGQIVKTVNNSAGTYIEDPATVALIPGRYTVVAVASGYGDVTVPVVVEAGKTTDVHLDGSGTFASNEGASANFVRLPDGTIVGRRAQDNIAPK